MRIGVMGGTFDPIHFGHLSAAAECMQRLALDTVIFIPTGDSWHKDAHDTSSSDRLAMVRLAIAEHPRFDVSDVDIMRAGPTYTVDTLTDLQVARAQAEPGTDDVWYFITGADALATMPQWRDPQRITELAHVIGVTRPGHDLVTPVGIAAQLIEVPGVDVSSRDIRARAAAGESLEGLVPDAVAAYIADHGLYSAVNE